MRSLKITRTQIFIAFALIIIFCIALYIRVYGNTYGLPYAEEADEPAIMDLAIAMLRTGDWNPHWFIYPGFFIYTQAFVTYLYFLWAQAQGTLTDIQQLSAVFHDVRFIPQPELYVWARTTTAIVGALTPLALYGAGARLYSRRVGILAALCLTFAFVHVQYSHFIRTDIPLTLFVTMGLWFAANILRRGSKFDYLLAGIACGLTFASKFNGFPIFLTVLLAHLLHLSSERASVRTTLRAWLELRKHFILFWTGLGAFVAFGIFNPFIVLNPNELFASLEWTRNYYGAGGSVIENANYYLSYLMWRGGFGDGLTIVAVLGLLLMLARHTRADLVAVSFPLVYFVLLLPWNYTNVRSSLPLPPFLALFVAVALVTSIDWFLKKQPRWRVLEIPALGLVVVALLISPTLKIQTEIGAMGLPTTRANATEWLPQNLPQGARVLSEARGAHSHPPLVHVNAQLQIENNVETLRAQNIDYIIVADEWREPLRAFDSSLQLVYEFPATTQFGGPTLRIFQVPPQPLPLQFQDASFAKTKYAPGEQAQLRAHWQINTTPKENNLPFVRLLNSQNEIAYELAEPPQQGNGRMKRWDAGRVVTDTHTLQLPNDLEIGRYRVQLGFYRDENKFLLPLLSNNAIVRVLDATDLKIAPPLESVTENAPNQTTDIWFDDKIVLRGYTIETNPLKHGETLSVLLYWQAAREMENAYTRFVHLKNSEGKLVAQNDGTPLGNFPTSVWTVGETVIERVEIPIPNDLVRGAYTLDVGWYEYPSLEHLRTHNAEFATLGNVEIQQ